MPIYEYRCKKGHTVEVLQSITDDALTKCEKCGAPCERVLHPVAVHFKGSGFYNTDYGTRKRQRENRAAADSGAEKNSAKAKEKADSKPAAAEKKAGGKDAA